jgi:NADH:ubiquinone oxidoreductase subunit 5 (subunit L)/multisubunit Na+/H+ antiporter MnhA subunit
MGFIIVSIGLGLIFLTLIHLISHALFKSSLFIQVGYIMHKSFSQQDRRKYITLTINPYMFQIQIIVTLLCLCGLVFTRGRVSKEIILFYFYNIPISYLLSMIFFLSVFLTFMYRYRLWCGLFKISMNVTSNSNDRLLFTILSYTIILLSISFIWWLNLNFLTVSSVFLYIDQLVRFIYLIILIFASIIVIKMYMKFIINKVFQDWLNTYITKKMPIFKFIEFFLIKLNILVFTIIIRSSYVINSIMFKININIVILILFMLFLL